MSDFDAETALETPGCCNDPNNPTPRLGEAYLRLAQLYLSWPEEEADTADAGEEEADDATAKERRVASAEEAYRQAIIRSPGLPAISKRAYKGLHSLLLAQERLRDAARLRRDRRKAKLRRRNADGSDCEDSDLDSASDLGSSDDGEDSDVSESNSTGSGDDHVVEDPFPTLGAGGSGAGAGTAGARRAKFSIPSIWIGRTYIDVLLGRGHVSGAATPRAAPADDSDASGSDSDDSPAAVPGPRKSYMLALLTGMRGAWRPKIKREGARGAGPNHQRGHVCVNPVGNRRETQFRTTLGSLLSGSRICTNRSDVLAPARDGFIVGAHLRADNKRTVHGSTSGIGFRGNGPGVGAGSPASTRSSGSTSGRGVLADVFGQLNVESPGGSTAADADPDVPLPQTPPTPPPQPHAAPPHEPGPPAHAPEPLPQSSAIDKARATLNSLGNAIGQRLGCDREPPEGGAPPVRRGHGEGTGEESVAGAGRRHALLHFEQMADY